MLVCLDVLALCLSFVEASSAPGRLQVYFVHVIFITAFLARAETEANCLQLMPDI